MDRAEFDDLFRRTVEEPLVAVGFRRHGKSLYRAGLGQAALIRGGGRLVGLHILAFRHPCLRELKTETVPDGPPRYPEDYPFVLDPSQLSGSPATWTIQPARLMRPPYGGVARTVGSLGPRASRLNGRWLN